jgi:hypothetical protein
MVVVRENVGGKRRRKMANLMVHDPICIYVHVPKKPTVMCLRCVFRVTGCGSCPSTSEVTVMSE